MLEDIVTAFIRAAATQYAGGVRQMQLYGLPQGDPLRRTFQAANAVRYPFGIITRVEKSTRAKTSKEIREAYKKGMGE